jgi:hypothetical protein
VVLRVSLAGSAESRGAVEELLESRRDIELVWTWTRTPGASELPRSSHPSSAALRSLAVRRATCWRLC